MEKSNIVKIVRGKTGIISMMIADDTTKSLSDYGCTSLRACALSGRVTVPVFMTPEKTIKGMLLQWIPLTISRNLRFNQRNTGDDVDAIMSFSLFGVGFDDKNIQFENGQRVVGAFNAHEFAVRVIGSEQCEQLRQFYLALKSGDYVFGDADAFSGGVKIAVRSKVLSESDYIQFADDARSKIARHTIKDFDYDVQSLVREMESISGVINDPTSKMVFGVHLSKKVDLDGNVTFLVNPGRYSEKIKYAEYSRDALIEWAKTGCNGLLGYDSDQVFKQSS